MKRHLLTDAPACDFYPAYVPLAACGVNRSLDIMALCAGIVRRSRDRDQMTFRRPDS